eukprot:CAMPEP_0181224672 /NCGR_PEP_ID=MMETSP1096-20121128/31257_1 /TAXON_ID=156174 ORGANISM="Chrysochromulina ericina, Strain CCMP281" /NCGR_SAMPLE_ID=MMETSP1096 /ASSEMBLY_ACC=CAM_ASM_000453 /LENGTH=101 /DNA_ID=CAMNT_0023317781 /DNA_START=800 /DNA_END=1105 /DNA_ORIENTATION=-
MLVPMKTLPLERGCQPGRRVTQSHDDTPCPDSVQMLDSDHVLVVYARISRPCGVPPPYARRGTRERSFRLGHQRGQRAAAEASNCEVPALPQGSVRIRLTR